MDKYIKEANEYYELAIKELEEASKNGSDAIAVDGCSKGWLALVLATNALFVKRGEKKIPRTYRGRVYLLGKYGTRELRRIFDKARLVLHVDGYYERFIDYERIFETMEDVKDYIEKIEDKN